jgi:hypothetical protein
MYSQSHTCLPLACAAIRLSIGFGSLKSAPEFYALQWDEDIRRCLRPSYRFHKGVVLETNSTQLFRQEKLLFAVTLQGIAVVKRYKRRLPGLSVSGTT